MGKGTFIHLTKKKTTLSDDAACLRRKGAALPTLLKTKELASKRHPGKNRERRDKEFDKKKKFRRMRGRGSGGRGEGTL